MRIDRHRRTLADGTQKTYLYAVEGSRRVAISQSTVSQICYRSAEKSRIVAALQANSSLLVVGESGSGKSVLGESVAEELKALGFPVAIASPMTAKQTLISIAEQLGVDTETMEGKAMTTAQLCVALTKFFKSNTAFLICDDAHRFQVQLRSWLEQLFYQDQPLLLLATFPPARDIFLKLPRIELRPLDDRQIRSIMQESAQELGTQLTTAQLASLQQRCGGNPMLAKRVVLEEHLGLEDTAPDHTQWIDGTPFLIAGLMIFSVVRVIGLGLNSTSLYLIGGILTVAVAVLRLLMFSLPRKSGRLGQ